MNKIEEIEAFPLQWPLGYERTPPWKRTYSMFKQTAEKAQNFLKAEVKRLHMTGLIVSTNIPVRRDGGYYAEAAQRKQEDPGVAIYFYPYGKREEGYFSMCCDRYTSVWENVYALGKSIEALRALERYGSSEMMKRVFGGFKQLPAPAPKEDLWHVVLGVPPTADRQMIRDAYLNKSKLTHPDRGGRMEDFIRVQRAYEYWLENNPS